MDHIRKYLRERDEEEEDYIMQIQSNNAQAAAILAQYQHMQMHSPEGRGSRPGRAPNVERHRQARGANMMEDYFVERPVYNNTIFRQRYRMQKPVFNRIMADLCNFDDFWHQKPDATGKSGFILEQKITGALRMLAYGAGADQCDEITRMGASTTLKCLKKICEQVEYLYGSWYLRPPNAADLQRLLHKGQQRGFPGMIGSTDCMHWKWKNCPKGWSGAFSGRKGYPTVILEAVASYDTHIWHAFFGTPGAQNDLNVLGASNVFARVIDGSAPNVAYKVNESTYNVPYYLVDGIYPRCRQTFVKAISKPKNSKEAHLTKMQEAYRKDVERCFGILQARWAIIRHGANLFKLEYLRTIMICCIILHNMIVEDEFVEDEFIESTEEDNLHPLLASVYEQPVDHEGNVIRHEPILRAGETLPAFLDAHFQLRSTYLHKALQDDLVIHVNK